MLDLFIIVTFILFVTLIYLTLLPVVLASQLIINFSISIDQLLIHNIICFLLSLVMSWYVVYKKRFFE